MNSLAKIVFSRIEIALVTIPLLLTIWETNWFLRFLNDTSVRPNPEVVRKLTELEAGLGNGTIKVEPANRAKAARAAAKIALSTLRERSSEYAPYVDLTDMLLRMALFTFAAQLILAIGIPLWYQRRVTEESKLPSRSGPAV